MARSEAQASLKAVRRQLYLSTKAAEAAQQRAVALEEELADARRAAGVGVDDAEGEDGDEEGAEPDDDDDDNNDDAWSGSSGRRPHGD
jgi:cobalamin biosynthesis protein CobT